MTNENKCLNADRELEEISLLDILVFLKKRLKLFLFYAALVFAFSVVGYLFVTPSYRVTASLQSIGEDSSPLASLNPMAMMLGASASSSIAADIELLNSRRVIDTLINENNLQFVVSKKRWVMATYFLDKLTGGNEPSGIFYVAKYPKNFRNADVVITKDGYLIESSLGKIACGWNSECNYGEGKLQLNIIGDVVEGNDFSVEWTDIITVRKGVLKKAAFLEIEGTGNMISLAYSSSNPFMSKFILADIIKQFSAIKKEWDKDDTNKKQEYIAQTLDNLKKKIDVAGNKLIEFQKSTDTFMPEKQIEITIGKTLDIVEKIDEIHVKTKLLSKTISDVQSGSELDPILVSFLAEDPSLQKMLMGHNELVFQLNQLTRKFTDEHPLVKELKSQIKISKQSIINSLIAQTRSLKNAMGTLSKQIGTIKKEQKKTPEKFFTYATLQRDLLLSEKLYTALAGKMFETSFDKRGGMDPVRVIDAPTSHVLKASPRTSLFIVIATLLSAILALGAIFVQEFFRNRLFDADEVQKYLPAQLYSLKKGDDATPLYQKLFTLFSITKGKSVLYASFTSTPALTQTLFSQLPQLAGKKSCFISFNQETGTLPQEILKSFPANNELLIALGAKEIPLFLVSPLFQEIMEKMTQTYDTVLLHVNADEAAITRDEISHAFDFIAIEVAVKKTRLTHLASFSGMATDNHRNAPVAALVLEEK